MRIDHLLRQTPPRHNASGRDMGILHLGVACKYVRRHPSPAGIGPHRSVVLGTMHGMPLIYRLPPHGVGLTQAVTNTRWPEISFDASWSAFEDKIFLTSSYAYMLELVACILTPHRFRVLFLLTRLSLLLLLHVRRSRELSY